MKQNNFPKIIGITGGVGAGKTLVLTHLQEHYPCRVLIADEIGNEVKEPSGRCYDAFVRLVGNDIIKEDGTIDKVRVAAKIFSDEELLKQVNALIHPAVREEIFERIDSYRTDDTILFFFLEAALLIEAGYVKDLDELWYISAPGHLRAERLAETRGYSKERIEGIMSQQLSEEEFISYADRVIENKGTKEELLKQIDEIMGGYTWQVQ